MVKLRGQLCDAPSVEVVGEAAADGSDTDRPAACAKALVTVCTDMGLDTSVGKKKNPKRDEKKTFRSHRTAVTWRCRTENKETDSILYSVSAVVFVFVSDSLLCSRPRVVSSGLLRAAEAASCFVA